jgi:type III secretory pathway component EscS
MYWKMIARFTVLIFILTFLVAFSFSVVKGFLLSAGKDVPIWLYLGEFLAELLAIAVVFTLLANVYGERILAYSRSKEKETGGDDSDAPGQISYASVQTRNSWPIINHAIVIALFSWLCPLPINVIILNQPLSQWAFSIIPIMSMAIVGLLIGFALRMRRNRAAGQKVN